MITVTKDLTMEQPTFDHIRIQRNLCGPYISDQEDSRYVRCYLQVARSTVAVDVPVEAIEAHRRSGAHDEIVLRVPGEELAPVEVRPVLSQRQQQTANRWLAEMEDFDRF